MALSLSILAVTVVRSLYKFDNFSNYFDKKENLIHVFAGEIYGLTSERKAIVQEGEAVTWGWEWFDVRRERVEGILEGSTTSLVVDGVQMLPGDGENVLV